jgi:hypothetical protein
MCVNSINWIVLIYSNQGNEIKGGIRMEFKFNRNTFLKLTNEEIVELLESITHFNLFSLSLDWRESEEFILKAKGGNGDVLVFWS